MNILLVEDRGSVSAHMKDALEQEGHNVIKAIDIYDAQSHWEDMAIDCLVIDCNLSPSGLSEKQIEMTKGGVITGWIWLRDFVFSRDLGMRERTIIYTEYMNTLLTEVKKEDLEAIHLVRKGGSSSAKQVLTIIENIAKKGERRP